MKFTLSWLKDHLDTTATIDEIAGALNDCGLEVEDVIDPGSALSDFTVAKVKEARQHPNADRLRVCDVETVSGLIQVVCGAPNARTGMTGIFAPAGTHIPGTGIDLQVGNIRGVESAGMLCSERELMISEDHDGIIDLEDHFDIGTPAAEALGLDDPVIDIAITPNRPDALGVYGIARDLAAKGLGKLKPLEITPVKENYPSPITVSLEFDNANNDPCPYFIGRHFRGLKNGPSPAWLARRLQAIGLRPISALVDITNYITYAHGRPLHVFDAHKVHGNIHARLARPGETITALDDKEYQLNDSMTVIADDQGPEAIAGVIGGLASGCTLETTDVFLEVAYFDPVRTAKTGRQLNINSDARYRFERGVDPGFMLTGAELASAMILELCGGEASELVIAGQAPMSDRSFKLRPSRVRQLGGLDVKPTEQERILSALGFEPLQDDDERHYKVPSWRPDVHGEADLVEEVCRIAGLEHVPAAPMTRPHAIARPVLNPLQKRMIAARRKLAQNGLNEAVTYSFLPKAHAQMFGGGALQLEIANPISSELSDMRPSLIPNLVSAASRNTARGNSDVGLFEVGHIYLGTEPEHQKLCAAGLRRGSTSSRHWTHEERPVDLFDAKADAMAALAAAGAPVANLQVLNGGPSWFHPGRCGTIQLGPKNQLGTFGELHPSILEVFEIKGPAVAFEIELDGIPQPKNTSASRAALDTSDLMPLSRDFAFIVDQQVSAQSIVRAARGAEKTLISNVSVFDLFIGDSVGENNKSVAIEVTLQPREKTLTDEEIEVISSKIIEKVGAATGGTLRR